MRLSVSYSLEDESVARGVRAVCDELGIACVLDRRNDWLLHGLRPSPKGCTHLVVVVSPASDCSWWLPFRLGRAAEQGITAVAYLSDRQREPPGFVSGAKCVRGLDALRARLRDVR